MAAYNRVDGASEGDGLVAYSCRAGGYALAEDVCRALCISEIRRPVAAVVLVSAS
jgi:hypothetical protein